MGSGGGLQYPVPGVEDDAAERSTARTPLTPAGRSVPAARGCTPGCTRAERQHGEGADDKADETRQHRRPGQAHAGQRKPTPAASGAGDLHSGCLRTEFTWRARRVHAPLRRFVRHPAEGGARPGGTGRRRRSGRGMREQFHEELAGLSERMVEMTRLVGSAVARATTALLDADLALAERVIARRRAGRRPAGRPRGAPSALLARQQPVATDLRIVVTWLRMSADLERMGDLARHVAKLARLRYPESAVPPELHATILQMGQVAERIVAKAGSFIASRDLALPGARAGRRRDGRAAPRAVHRAPRRPLEARHRDGGRRDPVRPLLRAVRRPCGLGRQAGRVPRDGRAGAGGPENGLGEYAGR